jgi:4-hydroxy-tetrahydrodipicolinate reductase
MTATSDPARRPAPAPIRVALSGANGRMGRVLGPALEAADGVALVARIDVDDDLRAAVLDARAEVVVDFTTPQSAASNARAILEAGADGVIGTTGFRPEDLEALDARAKDLGRGLLVAPNFALGAVLMMRFAAEAARHLPRAEIVEYHHEGKRDAPSGTAASTARAIEGSAPRTAVPIHSVRLPGLVAHQEVLLAGPGELLTIRHDALSRECFVPGVLAGVRAVRGKVGLLRGLESILFR